MTIGLTVVVFCAGYLSGVWEKARVTPEEAVQQILREASGEEIANQVDFSLYWEVWNRIRRDYVHQPVDEKQLFYGSVDGLVQGLQDPYSGFFDPMESSELASSLDGTFGGVGMELGEQEGQIVVIAPLPHTPAEAAGVAPGDAIIAIDDELVEGKNIDQVIQLIRGEKGTTVKLLLQREVAEPYELTLTRDTIVVESVKLRFEERDGKTAAVISLSQFTSSTTTDFHSLINEIALKQPDLVVLDLRNNPGGYVDAAVEVASEWVSQGTILFEQHQDGTRTAIESTGTGQLENFRTVVLINRGSASASEIVAGALQDNLKASVIGETSFGKGSVQDIHSFPDGSSLKLTISLWLTPAGRTIDKTGIIPDTEVTMTYDDFVAGKDPQLDAAFASLGQ